MRHRLRVAKRAAGQIKAAAGWWLENRPKAPGAFDQDLEGAFELITMFPAVGEPVQHSRLSGLRRVYLGRVRYHLYYVVSEASETVEVLALWHASRGRDPGL